MKFKIDNEAMFDGFFDDTRILGIMAPIEQYRFCWNLNQIMNIDFRINHSLEIQLRKKERNYFFPIYQYSQNTKTIKHYLYSNQNDGEYLLPEFRNLDFLWLIKDDIIADEEFMYLTNSIKSIPVVQMVVELTHEKIKNKQHLIF